MTSDIRPSRRGVLRAGAAAGGGASLASGWATTGVADASEPEHDRNPMKLWYDRPAEEWLEALAIGNGRLGAMVFGRLGTERLQLNEDSVWAGEPHDYASPDGHEALPRIRELIEDDEWLAAQDLAEEEFMGDPSEQMPYQPVGDLLLTFPHDGEPTQYHRELDLRTATTSVRYEIDGVRYTREVFASAVDQVIVMRLTADTPGSVSFEATFDSPQDSSVSTADERTVALDGVSGDWYGLTGSVRFQALARATASGGSVRAAGGRLVVEDADAATILVSVATSYRDYTDASADPAERASGYLEPATNQPYRRLRQQHITDYQRLFSRVEIDLGTSDRVELPTDERLRSFREGGDPQLAALYFQFGRYLLISCSRTPGQPANLQGLWNESMTPNWESKYTLNINFEMNYFPAGPTNLAECWEPALDLIHEVAESGQRTARAMYGANGWVVHHNTDGWRGTAPVDHAFYGLWPGGAAWLSLMLWDHYRYTGEVDSLSHNYPVMKGAVEFFLDTLQRDPTTGYLVTNPSLSPEVSHHEQDGESVSLCAGPTMDMQLLRDLFTGFGQAADLLDADPKLRDQALAAREQLAPTQIGFLGQIQEWLEDWPDEAESDHRHVSQLYGLFPSAQITPRDTPDLADAARTTLEIRGDEGTGWSLAWKINFWARLEEAARSYTLLSDLLTPGRTAPNLFDLHPPFQIDGNFGGVSGITEMILQSHAGEVHLLPALPDAFHTGQVRGLRARDGFVVDATWKDGEIVSATIRSDHGGRVRVRTPAPVRVTGPGGLNLERPEQAVVAFDTRPGASYRLRPDL